ncbi:DUF4132 domain-containing protein [Streptomyces sp. NPDC020875]|uniref:DUF4132 domain-containing protein n=1 Tax=Streptomyces sp. NPDC020875 TaxID=3154898 RepID=UPI0033E42C74
MRKLARMIADGYLVDALDALDRPAEFNGIDVKAALDHLHGLPPEDRAVLTRHLAARYAAETDGDPHDRFLLLLRALRLGHDLPEPPLAAERAAAVARLGGRLDLWWGGLYHPDLISAEIAEGRTVPPAVWATIRRSFLLTYADPEVAELNHLAGRTPGVPPLNVGEQWAEQALAEEALRPVVVHALTATAGKPTAKWDRAARAAVEAAGGADTVRTAVVGWLALVGRPRTFPLEGADMPNHLVFDPYNADALRGLAWLLSLLPAHPDIPRALGSLTEAALRKVPGAGPGSAKVAGAAVVALARAEGPEALGELARLATRTTHKPTVRMIGTALDRRAEALGIGRDEIEELAVPDYGLTAVGTGEYPVGDHTARLEIHGNRTVLAFHDTAGKRLRGVPAAVRRDHSETVKELKARAKDADRMLTAQAERLDRQFLARRVWSWGPWRERLLDHPLVGTLARRLIWTVGDESAVWDGTGLSTADGRPVEPAPDAEVGLWHPIGRPPAETAAWRARIEELRITQPFKQAHREIYPLTPAEETTRTYSNRYAAHILRQHQFHALAAIRGWRNKLRLVVDDVCPPAVRELPRWGLRAELWIGPDAGPTPGPGDFLDSGTYTRLRTDQLRFYPLDAPGNTAHCSGGPYTMWLRDGRAAVDPLPLTEIPELVLSEILRDLDLFVGVSSVGNDPEWADGGPEGHFREYWTRYGFGELTGTAATRKALLERIVPRLAFADRCSFDDRFLLVRGDLRTYRIHLGSGNVLMSPGDQYLCVVPGGSGPDPGYLPFEGDRTLSVILSKALLLADDTAITDPTIVSQFP